MIDNVTRGNDGVDELIKHAFRLRHFHLLSRRASSSHCIHVQ